MKQPPASNPPGEAHARNTDPGTSWDAAMDVDATKLENMYMAALAGGAVWSTTDIARHYGLGRDSFSPRSRPLLKKGWIECMGSRPTLSFSGRIRNMLVYRIKPKS